MTLGSGGGREYFYDTETTRVLDDFRGLEEQGDFSEKCDEALRLFSLHLQPIVEVYFQKDMGDDRMFIVKAKPWTEKDFVSLLQKHVRSFTNAEWPLPGYFERHARQLEILTCRRGGPGSTSVEALQYLSVMRSLIRIFPEKLEAGANDAISKEELQDAEQHLRRGKALIQTMYQEIKDEMLDDLAASRRGRGRQSFRHEDSRDSIGFGEPVRSAPVRHGSGDRYDSRNDGFSRRSSDRYRDEGSQDIILLDESKEFGCKGYGSGDFGERGRYWHADREESTGYGYEQPQRNERDRLLHRSRTDSPEYGDRRDGFGRGWNAQSPPERDRGPFYRNHSGDGQRYNSGYGGEASDGNRGWGSTARGSERFNDPGPIGSHSPRRDVAHGREMGGGMQLPRRPPRRGAPQGPSRSASGGVPRDNTTGLGARSRGELGRSLSDADRGCYERVPSWESRGDDRFGQRGSVSGRKLSDRRSLGRQSGNRTFEETSHGHEWDTTAATTPNSGGWGRQDLSRQHDNSGRDEKTTKKTSRSLRDTSNNTDAIAVGWGAASMTARRHGARDSVNRSRSSVDRPEGSNIVASVNPWGGSEQYKAPSENPWGATDTNVSSNPWGQTKSETDGDQKTKSASLPKSMSLPVVKETDHDTQPLASERSLENNTQRTGSTGVPIAAEQYSWHQSLYKREGSTVGQDNPWAQTKQAPSENRDNPWAQTKQAPSENQENPWAQTKQSPPENRDNPWAQTKQAPPENQDNPWAQTKQAPPENQENPWAQTKQAPSENQDSPWAQTRQAPSENRDNPWAQTKQAPPENQENPWAQTKQSPPENRDNPWAQTKQAPPENQENPWAQTSSSQTVAASPWHSKVESPVVSAPMVPTDSSIPESAGEVQNDPQSQVNDQQPWGSSNITALTGSMTGTSSSPNRQPNNPWQQSAEPSIFCSQFGRVSSAPTSLHDPNPLNAPAPQDMAMSNTGDAIWQSDPPTESSNFNSALHVHKPEDEKHISASSEMQSKNSGGVALSSAGRLKPPPGFERIVRRTASMPQSSLHQSSAEELQKSLQRLDIIEDDNDLRPPGI